MAPESPREISRILARVGKDGDAAMVEVLPVVYRELRSLAGRYFRRERPDHTLQPTALVHEAFIKLSTGRKPAWESRSQFLAVASLAMRRILVTHAHRRKAARRGGGHHRITLSGLETPSRGESEVDVLDLDAALTKLEELAPRQARIVEMRFLAGLDENEIASVLGVSPRTVRREWRVARVFLECELSGGGS